MLSLTLWSPKNAIGSRLERIYIQGGQGKAFLSQRGAHIDLNCDDPAEGKHLLALIQTQFGINLDGRSAWNELKAACSQPVYGRAAKATKTPTPPAGTSGDDALDFTTEFFVPPGEVVIEIDHREPIEFDALFRAIPNVVVERKTLPIGDFVLNRQHLYVERKTISDLEASIIDPSKRLFNQVEKMGFIDHALAFVIVEGDWSTFARMSRPQVLGALSYLSAIKGVSVLPSESIRGTSYLITKLMCHGKFGLGYQLALRGQKPTALLDARRFVLEGLPGVSAALADRLLAHFGSVRAVMSASRSELLAIEGVGPKTVDKMLAVMDGAMA